MRLFGRRVSQEPPAHLTRRQQQDRAADELVGLCRGILADGTVSSQEAQFVKNWIERNARLATEYPFTYLYRSLHSALTDGVIDPDEEADLLSALTALVGGETSVQTRDQTIASLSTMLPLCSPPPTVEFPGRTFVVTGTFAYGARALVTAAIADRGGVVKAAVSRRVDFLVIGEIGSQAWKHSSYGRKIEQAVALRDEGAPLRIVAEPHWARHLSTTP
jgi:NAD-dependent DNA ligase